MTGNQKDGRSNELDPKIGLAVLRAFMRERTPLAALQVMARRVGDFFQIPLPGFHPFVVSGPEANRKVLVTQREKLLWRNPDPVTDLLRRGVLVTDGEEHDRYRKLMEPAMHPSQLSGYAQMMDGQIDRVSATWQNGELIDMLVECRKIALLIIMQALFSVDIWGDLARLWTPILKAIEYISPGAWILWRKIPRPWYKKHLRVLDEYLFRIISDRRIRIESNISHSGNHPPADLLGHLVEAGLEDDLIRDQMLTMLIAGHDTSTALLAWTFVLLGQHPPIHTRLVDQLGDEDRPALLDQVIKEALRLYPPIHIGNRIVTEPFDFGKGNLVPSGERLFYSIYLTHRDPEIWEQADEFRPERFEHSRKTPPFSYVPFGGGPRACIGAAFGQAEARRIIARLLQSFTFVPENLDEIHAHMGATLEPRPGVMMRVTRKSHSKKSSSSSQQAI
jgi:cytochrome P450